MCVRDIGILGVEVEKSNISVTNSRSCSPLNGRAATPSLLLPFLNFDLLLLFIMLWGVAFLVYMWS